MFHLSNHMHNCKTVVVKKKTKYATGVYVKYWVYSICTFEIQGWPKISFSPCTAAFISQKVGHPYENQNSLHLAIIEIGPISIIAKEIASR